jgi:hypothetical protein
MTLGQFAYALGAPTKWVQNTWAILGLHPVYGEADLWHMALVRLLERAMEVPLKRAYATAQAAIPHPMAQEQSMELELVDEGALDVSIDWARFSSAVLAGLSRARTQYQERRRGRPLKERLHGIAAARAHGIDVSLLRTSLRRSPAERLRTLDEDLAFVQSLRVAR